MNKANNIKAIKHLYMYVYLISDLDWTLAWPYDSSCRSVILQFLRILIPIEHNRACMCMMCVWLQCVANSEGNYYLMHSVCRKLPLNTQIQYLIQHSNTILYEGNCHLIQYTVTWPNCLSCPHKFQLFQSINHSYM